MINRMTDLSQSRQLFIWGWPVHSDRLEITFCKAVFFVTFVRRFNCLRRLACVVLCFGKTFNQLPKMFSNDTTNAVKIKSAPPIWVPLFELWIWKSNRTPWKSGLIKLMTMVSRMGQLRKEVHASSQVCFVHFLVLFVIGKVKIFGWLSESLDLNAWTNCIPQLVLFKYATV